MLRLVAAVPLLLLAGVLTSWAMPRDALRATVEICVAMMAKTGLPLPCSRLEGQAGSQVAIIDPPIPGKHRLVVPVAPVSGIEDEVLLGTAGAAYFATAWKTALERAGGRWAAAAVVVNSARVRSQDQLHFHTDCQIPSGPSAHRRTAGPQWRQQGRYWVLSAHAPASGFNPFSLIRRIPGLSGKVADVNLGIFGAAPETHEWILLASSGLASFEQFLTSSCPH
jgi:CDP-diacylglycerol pyrophosphatase